MTIKKITQAEFKRIAQNRAMELGNRTRKQIPTTQWPGIYFKAPDGCYYVQDKVSPEGAKEAAEFQRKIKRAKDAQEKLF